MNWFSSQSPTYETETELAKYRLIYITSKNHFWHFWNAKWWCDASDLVIIYQFTCGKFTCGEFLFAKTDTAGCSALLKHIGGLIFMANVPPGIHLGSVLGSHRRLIIEQELAHHSARGVYSIHTYPHLLNYSASLLPALEGSQTQLHQLAGMSHQPQTFLRTASDLPFSLSAPWYLPSARTRNEQCRHCHFSSWMRNWSAVAEGHDSSRTGLGQLALISVNI